MPYLDFLSSDHVIPLAYKCGLFCSLMFFDHNGVCSESWFAIFASMTPIFELLGVQWDEHEIGNTFNLARHECISELVYDFLHCECSFVRGIVTISAVFKWYYTDKPLRRCDGYMAYRGNMPALLLPTTAAKKNNESSTDTLLRFQYSYKQARNLKAIIYNRACSA